MRFVDDRAGILVIAPEASFPDPASRPARHTLMLHNFQREIAVMAEFLAVLPAN
jgi:hypothetical protein